MLKEIRRQVRRYKRLGQPKRQKSVGGMSRRSAAGRSAAGGRSMSKLESKRKSETSASMLKGLRRQSTRADHKSFSRRASMKPGDIGRGKSTQFDRQFKSNQLIRETDENDYE